MLKDDGIFLLKFYGENIHPDSFSAKELGNLLINIEDSIKSVVDENYPKSDPNKCIISLIDIKDESDSIYLKAFGQPDTSSAFYDWGKALTNDSYINLPHKAYTGIRFLYGLVQKKKCGLKVVYKSEELGIIETEGILKKPEDYLISINTTIFGKVKKVGGAKPRIWIELEDGRTLSSTLTKTQAKNLSHKLYDETVSLKGVASWNTITENVIRFKLSEINNYNSGEASKAINELKSISSGFWDNFNSNDEILTYLRD